MLIIIEGCDCTAKSSLAWCIQEKLPGSELRHCGPPKEHPLDAYEGALVNYHPGAGVDVIYDRFHVGERVYGPVKRDASMLSDEGYVHVNLYLRSRGALALLTSAEEQAIITRMRDRGEDFITPAEVSTVLRGFRHEFLRAVPTLGGLTGSWETTNVNDLRMNVAAWQTIAAACKLEAEVAHLAAFPEYIGAPRPDILLLGEQRNVRPDEPVTRTAPFLPFPGSSGRYLMRAIGPYVEAGLDIGLVNALEVDLTYLWEALGCPAIIALGRVAEAECVRLGVPHGSAPHPQFWRRFHHHDVDGYRKQLFGRFT